MEGGRVDKEVSFRNVRIQRTKAYDEFNLSHS